MLDLFLLIGLPYAALFLGIGGAIYRFRTSRFSYSALSSQFLESRQLLWGSIPWHIGILLVMAGHAVALLFPGPWHALTLHRPFLLLIEGIGLAAALLSVAGLAVLLARRVTNPRIQAVTSPVDLVVLILLLGQVALGIGVSLTCRWGASWAAGTLSPYLFSLVTFRPDSAFVAEMPAIIKFHLAGAWLILLLLPFSRLVHLLSLPLPYLVRPPQRVVWTSSRRVREAARALELADSRRLFLRGAMAMTGTGLLLSIGVLDKVGRFFKGPSLSPEESQALLEERLKRIEQTAAQRKLELERMKSEYILVARVSDLQPAKGKYFIDYQMRPALAFAGADGLPILLSAKCTHLGCTVGSDVDSQGRILCPCHISHFDIVTGMPNAGAPAKDPLPRLGWVLMDGNGKVVVSQAPGGQREGSIDPATVGTCSVYIARKYEKEVA